MVESKPIQLTAVANTVGWLATPVLHGPCVHAGILFGCSGCNQGVSSQDVMAKVNGSKILRTEVDKSYNSQIAGSPQKPTAAEEEALRLQILLHLVDVQLHLQQAEKLGVVATDDEVDEQAEPA